MSTHPLRGAESGRRDRRARAEVRQAAPRRGTNAGMRDVSSPVLDRLDAGRGQLHALQLLLAGLAGTALLLVL